MYYDITIRKKWPTSIFKKLLKINLSILLFIVEYVCIYFLQNSPFVIYYQIAKSINKNFPFTIRNVLAWKGSKCCDCPYAFHKGRRASAWRYSITNIITPTFYEKIVWCLPMTYIVFDPILWLTLIRNTSITHKIIWCLANIGMASFYNMIIMAPLYGKH
jgi:hypothetical protein